MLSEMLLVWDMRDITQMQQTSWLELSQCSSDMIWIDAHAQERHVCPAFSCVWMLGHRDHEQTLWEKADHCCLSLGYIYSRALENIS